MAFIYYRDICSLVIVCLQGGRMAFIVDAVCAYPGDLVKQDEVRRILKRIWPDKGALIHQFTDSTSVESRHFSLPITEYGNLGHMGERNILWKKVALHLQKNNLYHLQEKNQFDFSEVGLISSATSTGLAVPGLEALVMNQFPISPKAKRMPLFGLGCLAGVAGMNRVNDFLEGHPDHSALLMVTELCSLTFQFGDSSIANIIGSALFGDGAAAVLMVGQDHLLAKKASFQIVKNQSIFYNNTERIMGWDMVESGFQIVLSNDIPKLVHTHVGKNIDEFLESSKLTIDDIKFFVAHPGGPKVLDALMKTLGKSKEDFSLSWESLKNRGNTSAASVVNVLEHSMKQTHIEKGSYGLMMAMGPAFSLELSLVKKC